MVVPPKGDMPLLSEFVMANAKRIVEETAQQQAYDLSMQQKAALVGKVCEELTQAYQAKKDITRADVLSWFNEILQK